MSQENANLEVYEGSVHDLMIEQGECKETTTEVKISTTAEERCRCRYITLCTKLVGFTHTHLNCCATRTFAIQDGCSNTRTAQRVSFQVGNT